MKVNEPLNVVDPIGASAGNVLDPATALISTIKTLPDNLNACVLQVGSFGRAQAGITAPAFSSWRRERDSSEFS